MQSTITKHMFLYLKSSSKIENFNRLLPLLLNFHVLFFLLLRIAIIKFINTDNTDYRRLAKKSVFYQLNCFALQMVYILKVLWKLMFDNILLITFWYMKILIRKELVADASSFMLALLPFSSLFLQKDILKDRKTLSNIKKATIKFSI